MTDPCGHSNSTHPSGCWYIAVVEAVAPLNAEIARLRAIEEAARHVVPHEWMSDDPMWLADIHALRAALGSER